MSDLTITETASPTGLMHNPFASNRHGDKVSQGTTQIEEARAVAQQQSAYIIAQARPRDEARSYAQLMQACQRKGLAEEAFYSFPRAGQTISGPTIRLAEEIARCWGNIDFGIVELSQGEGFSEMQAYAIDLQTNFRTSTTFVVKHERQLKSGAMQVLTDPRDVYEINSNMGSRRLRAMLLRVVPADIVEAAVEQCKRTLSGDTSTPLGDRIKKMILLFGQIGITAERMEKKLGRPLMEMTATEVAEWGGIYKGIKEGHASADEFFQVGEAGPNATPKEKTAAEKLAEKTPPPAEEKKAPKEKTPPKEKVPAAQKLETPAAKDEPATPHVEDKPAEGTDGDANDNPLAGGDVCEH